MELPLTHPKAKGGTMVMWHFSLSPHLKVLPSTSPSFVSVLSPLLASFPHCTQLYICPQLDAMVSGWLPLWSWSNMSKIVSSNMDLLLSSSEGISMLAAETRSDLPCSGLSSSDWSCLKLSLNTLPTTILPARVTVILINFYMEDPMPVSVLMMLSASHYILIF